MLTQAQVRSMVRECANEIYRHNDQIRALQSNMLDQIPLEQWALASSALDAILGKNRIIHMAESNTFSNVGVANTGQMSGTITGTGQLVQVNETAKELLAALENFKKGVTAAADLTSEEREDALGAVTDLEEQAAKPSDGRVMSKVRNAVAALKVLASGTTVIHGLYEQVHPFLLAHFRLP